MSTRFFDSIRSELGEVHRATNVTDWFPSAEHHNMYTLLELPPLEVDLRPGVVLLTGRLFNGARAKLVALATMVQLLFLSVRVHQHVNEDGGPGNDRTRLAVLIGDYYLGRFFGLVGSSGMMGVLQPLSAAVCRIHDGAISRLHLSATPALVADAVRQETAELIAQACLIAGLEGEAPERAREDLYRLGYSLGMGYGLWARGLPKDACQHLKEARRRLAGLAPGAPRDALDGLAAHLLDLPGHPLAGAGG